MNPLVQMMVQGAMGGVRGLTRGFGGAMGLSGLAGGAFGGRKRRRRVRLTKSDQLELQWIAETIGKTAAANMLTHYFRGR